MCCTLSINNKLILTKKVHTFQNIEKIVSIENWSHNSFFYQDFLSQTLTIHRTAGEKRGPSFIPLYDLHRLMNIQTFICNFACRWLSHIFNHNAYVYQTATRWDLPPYWITIWLIDRWCNVCILDDLILGLCYSNLTWETGGFGLISTVTLVLQANRLTKCTSHRLIG